MTEQRRAPVGAPTSGTAGSAGGSPGSPESAGTAGAGTRLDPAALDPGAAPDATEIARIVGLQDSVPRNLQITLGYSRLSRALGRLLGAEQANWCTFATWASRRAGQTIRGEELEALAARVRQRLEVDPAFHAALARVAGRLRERAAAIGLTPDWVAAQAADLVQTVSGHIAEGNLKVFAELAPCFAAFAALLDGGGAPDAAPLARFTAGFRPGDAGSGGQDLLRAAFAHYAAAAADPDPRAQAELILLANLQVGLHEQTRLQPNIAGALDAPVRWLRARLIADVVPRLPRWKRLLVRIAGRWLLAPVLDEVARVWREEATLSLMTLPVPGEVLGLGWDVPTRPGQPMFPPALQTLRHPELVALLRRYDRTWDTTAGSGARDWADLGDRMHYIADLFRARQQEPTLHAVPFTAAQCRAILEGRVPDGEL